MSDKVMYMVCAVVLAAIVTSSGSEYFLVFYTKIQRTRKHKSKCYKQTNQQKKISS